MLTGSNVVGGGKPHLVNFQHDFSLPERVCQATDACDDILPATDLPDGLLWPKLQNNVVRARAFGRLLLVCCDSNDGGHDGVFAAREHCTLLHQEEESARHYEEQEEKGCWGGECEDEVGHGVEAGKGFGEGNYQCGCELGRRREAGECEREECLSFAKSLDLVFNPSMYRYPGFAIFL